ncbi:phosphate ABC transporter substrate-binding protein [Methanospirillum purgamenti]|nr:phosphate ABC transporter substrate-binding protein [Methanospirillum hungatei]
MSHTMKTPVLRFAGIMLLLCAVFFATAPVMAEETTLSISGSTTVLPIASACAEAFMDAHPDVDVQVSGGGSGAGIKAMGEGVVSLAMASRELKDEEKTAYPELQTVAVAKDGIAVIVNPENPVEALTLSQIKDIYTGTITGWQDLGGETANIEIVGRDSASGTREFFFEKVLHKEDFTKFMLEKNSNGAVQQYVSQTPTAIGYVGMGFEDGVKVIGITGDDGKNLKPSVETVKSGTYPLSRELYFVTAGEPEGLAKEFLDFVVSAEGQKIVEEQGFVSL